MPSPSGVHNWRVVPCHIRGSDGALAVGGAQPACCATPQAQHFTQCNHHAACLAQQHPIVVHRDGEGTVVTTRRRRHPLSVSFHTPAVGHRDGEGIVVIHMAFEAQFPLIPFDNVVFRT